MQKQKTNTRIDSKTFRVFLANNAADSQAIPTGGDTGQASRIRTLGKVMKEYFFEKSSRFLGFFVDGHNCALTNLTIFITLPRIRGF